MPNQTFSDLSILNATRATDQFGCKRYQKKRYLMGSKCFKVSFENISFDLNFRPSYICSLHAHGLRQIDFFAVSAFYFFLKLESYRMFVISRKLFMKIEKLIFVKLKDYTLFSLKQSHQVLEFFSMVPLIPYLVATSRTRAQIKVGLKD